MLDAVVGLGSNVGDRRRILAMAVRALASRARIARVSALYESPAQGGPEQPDFLNAAVRLGWAGTPQALLQMLLAVEDRFGRTRRQKWGPRTLDLDILWLEGQSVREPGLEVPHPRLRERAFALLPLLDVAPGAVDPTTGLQISPLADCDIRRVEELDWPRRELEPLF